MVIFFYILGFFCLGYEIYSLCIIKPMQYLWDRVRINGSIPNRNLAKLALIKIAFTMFYTAWIYIGLFSSQWILFLALCLMSLVSKNRIYIRLIDIILSIIIILFIFLNKFYLHIQLFELFLVYIDKLIL